jgi:hypothetical protein
MIDRPIETFNDRYVHGNRSNDREYRVPLFIQIAGFPYRLIRINLDPQYRE